MGMQEYIIVGRVLGSWGSEDFLAGKNLVVLVGFEFLMEIFSWLSCAPWLRGGGKLSLSLSLIRDLAFLR